MNNHHEQLLDLLKELIKEYESKSLLEDEDGMLTWKTKMEWVLKQLNDMKFTALYDYVLVNKKLL